MKLFRKGEVEHVMDVVLAVIVVIGLIFLAVKLTMFFVNTEMRNAKAFVEDITAKIELLSEGESNTFALRGIENWVFIAWNRDIPIADEGETIGKYLKPQNCFDKNCLCLCKETISNCQENSYCRGIDRKVNVNSKGYFEGDGARYSGDFYFSCVYLDGSLNSYNIDKKNELLIISKEYGSIKTLPKLDLILSCPNFKIPGFKPTPEITQH